MWYNTFIKQCELLDYLGHFRSLKSLSMSKKSADKNKMEKVKKITKFAALELLKLISNIAEAVAMIADKKEVYRYAYGFGWDSKNLSRGIYRLKKSGYITLNNSAKQQSIELTNKAKIKTLEIFAKKLKVSDKYRFLSFDVPAKFNFNRNKFRKLIKKIGFVKVQQSLWVINKDVSDLVEVAIYDCKVEKYVAYIISEQSDIDGIIKKLLSEKLSQKNQ